MDVVKDGREKDLVGAKADAVERVAAVRRWKKRIIIFDIIVLLVVVNEERKGYVEFENNNAITKIHRHKRARKKRSKAPNINKRKKTLSTEPTHSNNNNVATSIYRVASRWCCVVFVM